MLLTGSCLLVPNVYNLPAPQRREPRTAGSNTAGLGGCYRAFVTKEGPCRLSFFGSVALLHIPTALGAEVLRGCLLRHMFSRSSRQLPAGELILLTCADQATSGTARKGNKVLFWVQIRAKSIGLNRGEG